MLNTVKSTFTVAPPRAEVKALVEDFATQEKQRLYPFELQNFKLGARFQSADPQTQRVIVMAMVAWLDQHSLHLYGREDQNAWQKGWKVREALLHMLKFNIPFHEQDVIAMVNWSASQCSTSAYVYFSGVPQIIKVIGAYLENNPMTGELHESVEWLARSIESQSTSVEVRRWLLQLKELMGETQVSLPLAAGDRWADTALKELYALNARTKTAWAELLAHCAHATGPAPNRRWLAEADQYINIIENLNFFIKLSHWFPLADQPQMTSANATILKGLVWLCAKSEDPEIAFALAALAINSYQNSRGSGPRAAAIGNACLWALANMPIREGTEQLMILKDKIENESARKKIEKALQAAITR